MRDKENIYKDNKPTHEVDLLQWKRRIGNLSFERLKERPVCEHCPSSPSRSPLPQPAARCTSCRLEDLFFCVCFPSSHLAFLPFHTLNCFNYWIMFLWNIKPFMCFLNKSLLTEINHKTENSAPRSHFLNSLDFTICLFCVPNRSWAQNLSEAVFTNGCNFSKELRPSMDIQIKQ